MSTTQKTFVICLLMALFTFTGGLVAVAYQGYLFIAYLLGTFATVMCPTKACKKD